ncbi:DUF3164 family protein [Ignatzschineria rhizosphaerae]|uniref:DUF3164 family protein n=1 Tax=Ignatzschineria rhizosphaerae TaxID=2923279 RepID=A0ABY3WYL2_9GAMM|nr:DUF3164 family protein [Ignatzschineria rhizosphaerae]UNM95698.1 DUF3164 family protein [Ignatzschineria rhizosphaerae]
MDLAQYRTNMQGHLVHIDNIKQEDLLRDEVVKSLTEKAKKLQSQMAEEKKQYFLDFDAYVELALAKYEVVVGKGKGNVTLYSYDGKYKIMLAISENIRFNENIHAAEKIIKECISKWSVGANKNLAIIANTAFRTNAQGNISNIKRILELLNYDVDDERWQQGMQAIRDSIIVTSSKKYMRFYELQEDGSYAQISLDFAAI